MASIVGVLAVIVPAVMWIDARYQTASAADLHARDHRRERAEVLYQLSRQEVLILRNRVNDCNARLKPSERIACDQYRQEYREAERRAQFLFQETQKAAK